VRSGVVVLATTTFAQLRANNIRLLHASPITITDPTMSVISTMVGRRELWGASARVGSSQTIRQAGGLVALRRVSALVLCRGLQDYDPYERYTP
jgi:hypothetical protein